MGKLYSNFASFSLKTRTNKKKTNHQKRWIHQWNQENKKKKTSKKGVQGGCRFALKQQQQKPHNEKEGGRTKKKNNNNLQGWAIEMLLMNILDSSSSF